MSRLSDPVRGSKQLHCALEEKSSTPALSKQLDDLASEMID